MPPKKEEQKKTDDKKEPVKEQKKEDAKKQESKAPTPAPARKFIILNYKRTRKIRSKKRRKGYRAGASASSGSKN